MCLLICLLSVGQSLLIRFDLFWILEWAIRIYHECEGRIEKSVPRIAVWLHKACRVMTNGDPGDGFFCTILTRIMDSFSYSPLFLFIYLFEINF